MSVVNKTFLPEAPTVFHLFKDAPTDFEIIVGSDNLPVHKHFLSLISPVFQAMFSNDTLESQTGKVVITDFDFETVKTAIGYCYGRESKVNIPSTTFINVLRFADKYIIKAVIEKLEERIPLNLSTQTFFDFLQYALDYSKDKLLTECHAYFKAHQAELKSTNTFASLPIPTMVNLLKAAFNLKTDFDVLRHANKNFKSVIINRLESSLIAPLTLANFGDTVRYAYDCSRKELQKTCAKFLNDNRVAVTSDRAFLRLPANNIKDVLVLSLPPLPVEPLPDLYCDSSTDYEDY